MKMIDVAVEYFDSPEGQYIAGACAYLTAAKVLRHSDTWKERPGLLLKPSLHLAAHGIELLLKFPMVRLGADVDIIRQDFGHDLTKLWAAPGVANMRGLVTENAAEVWAEAKASGNYREDDFDQDPVEVLEKALARLAELHGRATDFALRYVADPKTFGPRPGFLVEAFGVVAERVMRAPRLVDEGTVT